MHIAGMAAVMAAVGDVAVDIMVAITTTTTADGGKHYQCINTEA